MHTKGSNQHSNVIYLSCQLNNVWRWKIEQPCTLIITSQLDLRIINIFVAHDLFSLQKLAQNYHPIYSHSCRIFVYMINVPQEPSDTCQQKVFSQTSGGYSMELNTAFRKCGFLVQQFNRVLLTTNFSVKSSTMSPEKLDVSSNFKA